MTESRRPAIREGTFPSVHIQIDWWRHHEDHATFQTAIMRLIRSHEDDIDDPTEKQIDDALADLGADAGDFVILTSGDPYIQASGASPDDLVVEYRTADHTLYRSASRALSLDEVRGMFRQYRQGKTDWKQGLEWNEVEETERASGCLGMSIAVVLAGAGIALL